MDGRTVTDFSIERILSPQLGLKSPGKERSPDGHLQVRPGGFSLDYTETFRPPVPVPVPVPGCQQYRGMSFEDAFYPYGAAFHHFSSLYPNSAVYLHFSRQDPADAQQLAGYHGYNQAAVSAQTQQQQQQQPRQKSRMRTVFTDGQTRQLEALFELADYPSVEARAQLAGRTGLSEETVRVWFKNRRARRKRQRSGSKVTSPSPPISTGAESKLFSSFL